MRTNIVIDDKLFEKGMKYTGINKKKQLVDFALRELVNRKERKRILGLKGKLRWEGNLDEMRRSRSNDSR
ncbi:MAG: transcriptional regulator of the Arc/MetJ class [Deltaproteobacteria bacterium RBG_19FT_COMBO_46_12]|nr:MAG: transcriptional regulator of the Arc/MetJ class [Deltaproteobacteria bacterium RBG_19FT_COMBO_46_12]